MIIDNLQNSRIWHQPNKVTTVIIFIALILFIYLIPQKLSDIIYLYSFSTISQSFLALVGFLGAAAVYKLQLIENDLTTKSKAAEEPIGAFVGHYKFFSSHLKIKEEAEKLIKGSAEADKELEVYKALVVYVDTYNKLVLNKKEIRTPLLNLAVIIFVNIALSLAGLSLVDIMANQKYWSILLCVCLSLSFYSLVVSVTIIRRIFGYDFSI